MSAQRSLRFEPTLRARWWDCQCRSRLSRVSSQRVRTRQSDRNSPNDQFSIQHPHVVKVMTITAIDNDNRQLLLPSDKERDREREKWSAALVFRRPSINLLQQLQLANSFVYNWRMATLDIVEITLVPSAVWLNSHSHATTVYRRPLVSHQQSDPNGRQTDDGLTDR